MPPSHTVRGLLGLGDFSVVLLYFLPFQPTQRGCNVPQAVLRDVVVRCGVARGSGACARARPARCAWACPARPRAATYFDPNHPLNRPPFLEIETTKSPEQTAARRGKSLHILGTFLARKGDPRQGEGSGSSWRCEVARNNEEIERKQNRNDASVRLGASGTQSGTVLRDMVVRRTTTSRRTVVMVLVGQNCRGSA